jgi:hypothetical protein
MRRLAASPGKFFGNRSRFVAHLCALARLASAGDSGPKSVAIGAGE